jgi:hypothetical protein
MEPFRHERQVPLTLSYVLYCEALIRKWSQLGVKLEYKYECISEKLDYSRYKKGVQQE